MDQFKSLIFLLNSFSLKIYSEYLTTIFAKYFIKYFTKDIDNKIIFDKI